MFSFMNRLVEQDRWDSWIIREKNKHFNNIIIIRRHVGRVISTGFEKTGESNTACSMIMRII